MKTYKKLMIAFVFAILIFSIFMTTLFLLKQKKEKIENTTSIYTDSTLNKVYNKVKKNFITIVQKVKIMKNITSIYVCYSTDSTLDKVCNKDNLVKVIKDKNDIDRFITIVQSAEVIENITFVKDSYTLYLVNSNDKIISVIDYDPHLIIRLSDQEIYLSSQENSMISKILNIESKKI